MIARKVGLLTHHEAQNFGAVLQAFALRRTIAGLGHACMVIDCRESTGAYRLFRVPVGRESIRHDALMLMNLPSHLRSRRRFRAFREAHLALTRKAYWSTADLSADNDGFDAFVSGSDQVWHPSLLDQPLGRFLFQDFTAGGRRVAYAPSFGVSKLPAGSREQVRKLVKQFEYLSAREDSGCAILEDLTGRAVEQVLDPTLLLKATEYDALAADIGRPGPYILLYPMLWSDDLRRLVLSAKARLGVPIVAVLPPTHAPWRFSFADRLVLDAGPAEFLAWVKGAAYVCTSSFHGTCFSIIYRKHFLSIPGEATGTRQLSLLRCLGLTSRLVGRNAPNAASEPPVDPVDYSTVENLLAREVERSLAYLRRALTWLE